MRKSSFFGHFSLILMALLFFSCSKFRQLQKSTDWQAKYHAAVAYYEQEEYFKASTLLDQVIPVIKGTVDGEKATFLRAYAYYHQQQFYLSSEYFREFVRVYSRSEYALEAGFLHAHSLYMQSPEYNLDQSSTIEAITAFQTYLNRNPYSEYAPRSSAMIDDLQRRLEKKNFENAKHYHKLERWQAARIAFETFEDEFPDSDFVEEVKYLAIDAQFSYAKASVPGKQKERFEETVDLYQVFIDKYPKSDFIKEAESRYSQSLDFLKKL